MFQAAINERNAKVMKKWLTANSKWLGALGAIAAIIAAMMMVFDNSEQSSSTQELVINGNNNEPKQRQDNQGGKQTTRVQGDDNKPSQTQ